MKHIITIVLIFIACNCKAQRVWFDTTLNVVSNGANLTFKAKCDSNILNYAAYDSSNICKFSVLIPDVKVGGRTDRMIFRDSIDAIITRYNLTISK